MAILTIQDMRDAGVTEEQATNDRLTELITFWQHWVELMTGLIFEKTTLTINLDGTGCDVLWLPLPIITLTSLYMNSNFNQALDATTYQVYNRYVPDDRWNPKIRLIADTQNIYTGVTEKWERNVFLKDQIQRVIGDWGFVEDDGTSPPPLIKYLIERLIILNLDKPADYFKNWSRKFRLNVKSERTDYHSYSLGRGVQPGMDSLTGDKELDQILMYFRKARAGKIA